jgi:hypothetical protein
MTRKRYCKGSNAVREQVFIDLPIKYTHILNAGIANFTLRSTNHITTNVSKLSNLRITQLE